jgi:hypothetical protein
VTAAGQLIEQALHGFAHLREVARAHDRRPSSLDIRDNSNLLSTHRYQ